jgi:hypothetical protein
MPSAILKPRNYRKESLIEDKRTIFAHQFPNKKHKGKDPKTPPKSPEPKSNYKNRERKKWKPFLVRLISFPFQTKNIKFGTASWASEMSRIITEEQLCEYPTFEIIHGEDIGTMEQLAQELFNSNILCKCNVSQNSIYCHDGPEVFDREAFVCGNCSMVIQLE